MGPNLARILENYSRRHRIVLKVCKYLGIDFGTGQVVTQGNPASPMIFTILVDAVVREVIEKVCSPQVVQHGMGWAAGEMNLVFYADD